METRLPQPKLENISNGPIRTETKLLLWVFVGFSSGTGVALLALLVSGWETASVVAGICLIATALSLVQYLHRIDKPSVKAILHNANLVRSLSGMHDKAIVVASLEGDCLASNDAFDALFSTKIWNLRDVVDDEIEDGDWVGFLDEASKGGHAEIRLSIDNEKHDAFVVKAQRIDSAVIFEFLPIDTDAPIKEAIESITPAVTQWLTESGHGVLVSDITGNVRYSGGAISNWFDYADQDISSDLSLESNGRKLVFAGNDHKKNSVDIETVTGPISNDGQDVGFIHFLTRLDAALKHVVQVDSEFIIDAIFDEAPLSVAIVSEDCSIKELNASLKSHMAGADLDTGDSILSLIHKDDRDEFTSIISDIYKGRSPALPLDVRFNVHPQRVGQVFFSSILNNGEKYVVLYINDTTQEKSLERQFVQAQKMQAVGQLAGGVAHDFNNLLTAIIGFCDLLLVRHDAGDQSFSDIIQIKQNANRAANLVRQLLAFSRQQTLRPKVLMITDILAELSNLLRRLIGERINLKVIHGRDLKPVKVDQGQLEQVIINLAVNARDAMDESGELEIRTSLIGPDHEIVNKYDIVTPDEYIMVQVIDDGCGISKDNLGKIFEPFFTTKEVGQGTGLGLATVYGIVKQTGGYVFAESEVGKGTTFFLLLKAHTPSEQEAIEANQKIEEAPARDLTGKGTILIVEDEDPVRMFASRALTNKGYTVLEAVSGEHGLEVLIEHEGEVDLLISDVVMPQMDGPALVAEARKRLPNLPVIFVSGYAEDMVRKDLEDEDFHFLPKPFSLKELAENVKTILQ
ncbi:ATP-binding protein [Kordiimonas sp. SCSIO 12610]|uniref:ATP-binding protein n=1 Tax=Kordiimonas sp. SCSIO 12610 TaxID=2829597 RepID=UPI00210C8C76|nr:ATP-binding protein [Kordiimonas sp. SCSIO 12610]UTW56821.1 response regulator [Kordiimonas sp. SCSIO 12610]